MDTKPDSTPPRPAGGFFVWIRNLGIVRSSSERWFAGVAGGIAAKAGIDPLIVRGLFVVLALLGGPGILLYLVGWLLLPDTSGRIRLEDLSRGRVEGWTIAAVVAVAIISIPTLLHPFANGTLGWFGAWSFFGIPGWLSSTFTWLVWIAIIVLGSVWIARDARGRTSERSDTQSTSWVSDTGEKAEAWGRDFSQRAEAWGESLSARTDSWSEQYTKRHEARKLGAAHVIITLALALLAGGTTALWASGFAEAPTSSFPIVAGLIAATAVFAFSLIIAGIRGKNSGWVGFLAACGTVALVFTAVLPAGTQFQPFGIAEVDARTTPGFAMVLGTTNVDLNKLDNKTEKPSFAEQDKSFEVWQLGGKSTVTLPKDQPAVVEVRVLAGTLTEKQGGTEHQYGGPFLFQTVKSAVGDAERKQHSPARITVYLGFGSVRVVSAQGATVLDVDPEPTSPEPRTKNQDTQTQELQELEERLAAVKWQLEEPGLSKASKRTLESELAQLEQDISDLERETAR